MNQYIGRKREALVALAIGVTISCVLDIWFNIVATPQSIDEHMWLARLHEPATEVGEWLGHSLYSMIGYPWNVRVAIAAAYSVLVGMWTLIAFGLLVLYGALHQTFKTLQRR